MEKVVSVLDLQQVQTESSGKLLCDPGEGFQTAKTAAHHSKRHTVNASIQLILKLFLLIVAQSKDWGSLHNGSFQRKNLKSTKFTIVESE